MTTLLMTHPACLAHEPGSGHAERPARLEAVIAALDDEAFAGLERREASLAPLSAVARAHSPDYVRALLDAIPDRGLVSLDPDTQLSPGSGEAALRAAGAVLDAVDAVMAGEAQNAFCAVRPPGHHAEPERAMGFCLFGNAAIAALHARDRHGLERIAVLDFDVHHGNGTQARLWDEAGFFFASSHQMPLYPGSGAREERGARGEILNVPLNPGDGSAAFRLAWGETVLPALRAFAPQFVVVSAGFDGHARDPLANLAIETADYLWVTAEIAAVAAETAQGRLVSTLEGGYDLDALAESAAAHVTALLAASAKTERE
ncbi:MAG: histone deacetylase family protein [Rhodospirillales bacterium]